MKIFWTKFALNSLHNIFNYYKENVNKLVAQNIKNSILSGTRQLEKQPLSGTIEKLLLNMEEGHRYIIRGNYKIIYKIQNKKLFITDVFDTRQDPESIKRNSDLGINLNEPID
jgi:plasmid stabilization system protein ParE